MKRNNLTEEFQRESSAVYRRAIQSLFDRLSAACEGAMAVDHEARISWINDKYVTALGLMSADQALGRPVEEVIPNSLMRQVTETGEPILLDIMKFGEQSFVVTRMPLFDDEDRIIGAIGFVLYDRLQQLEPLVSKFAKLQTELTKTKRALAEAHNPRYTLANYIGSSPSVVEVKREIRCAAEQDSTVLLLGETGTGKELVAQAIHGISARARMPIVAVNVAAIPESLLEAEMFGVAPGAYTGADRRGRIGKFQVANGGSLFLDEIGDMPLQLQAKLLRALQEREIEPLGSNKVMKVDVRIIAATNVDLAEMVKRREFRSDLFYRLNVVSIRLPALREIKDDIEAIAHTILEQIAARTGLPLRSIAPSGLAALRAYDWPGNVRELRNVLERACIMGENARLSANDFLSLVPAHLHTGTVEAAQSVRKLTDVVDETERSMLQKALDQAGGKAEKAAKLIGISRASFYKKAARLRIRL
jgi:transcriptional regulator with PAS, ATPase and Fis domain